MSLVDWASAEPYDKVVDLGIQTAWESRANSPLVSNTDRLIFNFPGERWFNLGANTDFTDIKRVFPTPLLEGEFSASINIDEGASINQVAGIDKAHTIMGIRRDDNTATPSFETIPSFPGVHICRRTQIPGDSVYIYVHGVAPIFEGVIPNFTLTPGGLYYFTVRWRDSTGTPDGVIEVWCNNQLLWSDNAVDLAGVDLTNQSVVLGPVQGAQTYARNLTIHNEWTTAPGVAPKHKNVFEVVDLNVIDTTNYTLEGTAATIAEALTDGDETTLISTITPSAVAEFGIANIPAIFSTNDVLDVGTRVKAARQPNGYASPIITITDTVSAATHGTATHSVLAVGNARDTLLTTGTVNPATTMDTIRITIDSGT